MSVEREALRIANALIAAADELNLQKLGADYGEGGETFRIEYAAHNRRLTIQHFPADGPGGQRGPDLLFQGPVEMLATPDGEARR